PRNLPLERRELGGERREPLVVGLVVRGHTCVHVLDRGRRLGEPPLDGRELLLRRTPLRPREARIRRRGRGAVVGGTRDLRLALGTPQPQVLLDPARQ